MAGVFRVSILLQVDPCGKDSVLPGTWLTSTSVVPLRLTSAVGLNGGNSTSDSTQAPIAAFAGAATAPDGAVTAEKGGADAAELSVAAVSVDVATSVVDVTCYRAMGVLREVPAGDSA